MTGRGWTLLIVILVVLGLVALYVLSLHRGPDPAAFKQVFSETCLKQANDAAQAQGKPYNEEQKQMLQQVCSCGADKSLKAFTSDDLKNFMNNPGDPSMLDRVKPLLADCARDARLPGATP